MAEGHHRCIQAFHALLDHRIAGHENRIRGDKYFARAFSQFNRRTAAVNAEEDVPEPLPVTEGEDGGGGAIRWDNQRGGINAGVIQHRFQQATLYIDADRAQGGCIQPQIARGEQSRAGATGFQLQHGRHLMVIRHNRQLHLQQKIKYQIADRDESFAHQSMTC